MKRIIAMLLLLYAGIAYAEAPYVIALPEGLALLENATVGNDGDCLLLALSEDATHSVKLAIADKMPDGIFRITALSGLIINLDAWDPDEIWMLDKWDDGHPYFWYGTNASHPGDECYLNLEQNADGVWMVASGFTMDHVTGLMNQFYQEEAGYLVVNSDTISPAIRWPSDLPMTLEGFVLHEVDDVCSQANRYLDTFDLEHPFGAQADTYEIIW